MARRTSTARQGKLPVEGMDGPDPELTRLCEESLNADDEHEQTGIEARKASDAVKAYMKKNKTKARVVHQGVAFLLSTTEKLTKKGKRSRDEED